MIPDEIVIKDFVEKFAQSPQWIARAPGRVNLIGEHTDYNGGFVLPVAINREIKMAASFNLNGKFNLYSTNYENLFTFDLETLAPSPSKSNWQNYFLAVLAQFMNRGIKIPGLNVLINGDIPLGAGLSSSAAFTVCCATLLNAITGAGLSKKELALLAQAAEHSKFVGVNCGIMDQFVSALAKRDTAMLLDCYNLEYELVPMDSTAITIVIVNTMRQRGLVESEYNRRREECEEGLKIIKKLTGEVFPTLRHISPEIYEKYREYLPENIRKRVKHNLTENQRVHEFVRALREKNYSAGGHLLYHSHYSLRDDYEVSCAELDYLVEASKSIPGVYGCRMTGAGFGGCVVALVEPEFVSEFTKEVSQRYYQNYAIMPEIYTSTPAEGADISYVKS